MGVSYIVYSATVAQKPAIELLMASAEKVFEASNVGDSRDHGRSLDWNCLRERTIPAALYCSPRHYPCPGITYCYWRKPDSSRIRFPIPRGSLYQWELRGGGYGRGWISGLLRDSRHGVPELGIILFRDIRPWGDFSLKFLRSAGGGGDCSECNIMVPDWLGHLGRGRFEHQPTECDCDLLACL